MALDYFKRKPPAPDRDWERRIEPGLGEEVAPRAGHGSGRTAARGVDARAARGAKHAPGSVFDSGARTIIDCPHVKVERLDTQPVLYSKVFKEFEDRSGQKYDYRYWAERENFILREFLKKQSEFTHVVQARHLISENDAAKQVLTRDAGITVADWLRVKPRYGLAGPGAGTLVSAGSAVLSHPFQRLDSFLHLLRACLVALKEIHSHRIVHCDIKEDNICIPYAQLPASGAGKRVSIDFARLKLIDFAFSVAHAIPLTQILVVDPEQRVPYQSELLIGALRADRLSGSPEAVQQIDYRVDLFSLGYMAGKISAAGLYCPPGAAASQAVAEVRGLVEALKDFDHAPKPETPPHDGLLAEIDRLLAVTARLFDAPDFSVAGEWTAEEMAHGRGADRKTPLTPVAPPPPTPIALPVMALAPARRRASKAGWVVLGCAIAAVAAGAFYLYGNSRQSASSMATVGGKAVTPPLAQTAEPKAVPPSASARTDSVPMPPTASTPPSVRPDATKLMADLHGDDDATFQAAWTDLAHRTAGGDTGSASVTAGIVKEYGDALASAAPQPVRARALRRLKWMAGAGDTASAQRVTDFEQGYDQAKQAIATSAWWARGEGPQPDTAARWVADGELLADSGDRPAMLDRAFALGHGRAVPQDRVAAVETYLNVLGRSVASDGASQRIHQSATHGFLAVLDAVVRQKDEDAAQRLRPVLKPGADAGSAGLQYYLGLMSECVAQPADFGSARQWYRLAAQDPAWKRTVAEKARQLGRACPAGPA